MCRRHTKTGVFKRRILLHLVRKPSETLGNPWKPTGNPLETQRKPGPQTPRGLHETFKTKPPYLKTILETAFVRHEAWSEMCSFVTQPQPPYRKTILGNVFIRHKARSEMCLFVAKIGPVYIPFFVLRPQVPVRSPACFIGSSRQQPAHEMLLLCWAPGWLPVGVNRRGL